MLRFSGPAIVPVSCGPRVDRDNRFESTNIQFIFDIPETLSEGAFCGEDRTVGVGGRCALRSEKDVWRCLSEQGADSGHSLCGGRMEDVKEVCRFRCVEWQTEVREEGGGLCRRMYRGSENKIPLPHICSKGVFIFIYRSGAAGRFRDADDPIRLLRYSASRNLF